MSLSSIDVSSVSLDVGTGDSKINDQRERHHLAVLPCSTKLLASLKTTESKCRRIVGFGGQAAQVVAYWFVVDLFFRIKLVNCFKSHIARACRERRHPETSHRAASAVVAHASLVFSSRVIKVQWSILYRLIAFDRILTDALVRRAACTAESKSLMAYLRCWWCSKTTPSKGATLQPVNRWTGAFHCRWQPFFLIGYNVWIFRSVMRV